MHLVTTRLYLYGGIAARLASVQGMASAVSVLGIVERFNAQKDHGNLLQALANAIEKALLEMQGKPEVWQQRRSACRKHIEDNFSIEKMVEKYHVVWDIKHA